MRVLYPTVVKHVRFEAALRPGEFKDFSRYTEGFRSADSYQTNTGFANGSGNGAYGVLEKSEIHCRVGQNALQPLFRSGLAFLFGGRFLELLHRVDHHAPKVAFSLALGSYIRVGFQGKVNDATVL